MIFFSFHNFLCQNIVGKVVNDADQPIADVHIYLNGTKKSTVSGRDGSFSLQGSSFKNSVLVFQKNHYEMLTVNASDLSYQPLKVVLLKSKNIEEVKIIPFTEEAYRNYIGYFLDTFIGEDQKNVKIRNQRSLRFSYDKENRILKVKAPETLIIENKNLGYTIEYNLISFSADFKTTMIHNSGTSLFTETKNTDKIRTNRMNAYEGSLLHFFRSLYNNTVEADAFVVNHVIRMPNPKYPTEEELKILKDYSKGVMMSQIIEIPENIRNISQRKNKNKPFVLAIVKTRIPDSTYVKRENGKVFFSFKDMLQVNYKKYHYVLEGKNFIKSKNLVVLSSFLHPEGKDFEVFQDGHITDPDNLITEGDFIKNKIENMLPLDYRLGD